MKRARYVLHGVLGTGGNATVHLATLVGEKGFRRPVAVKRVHEAIGSDPEVIASLVAEARLAGAIHHPNVVATIDVASTGDDVLLVMDYVEGDTLARLVAWCAENDERIPVPIALAIIADVLRGLHAAHETKDATGSPRALVHRDVSPQNVMVGIDGMTRVCDFGIAKALDRVSNTRTGEVKGKLGYMAPEQLTGHAVDRRADIWSTGVVLWEVLTTTRLFREKLDRDTIARIMSADVEPPSSRAGDIPPAIDAIVLRALARAPGDRFPDARAMVKAIESATEPASMDAVAQWVAPRVEKRGAERRAALARGDEGLDVTETTTLMVEPPRARLAGVRWVHAVAASGVLVLAATIVVATSTVASRPPAAPEPEREPAPSSSSSSSWPEMPPSEMASSAEATISSGSASPPAVTARSGRPATNRSRCDPPYTFDEAGRKRFKKECFAR